MTILSDINQTPNNGCNKPIRYHSEARQPRKHDNVEKKTAELCQDSANQWKEF